MTAAPLAPASHSAPPLAGATRLRETALQTTQRLDLSFTGEDGRSFQLSIERETAYYSLTYDRLGGLSPRGRGAHGHGRSRESREGGLERAFGEMERAVEGFRRLLHRFAQAADPRHAARPAPPDAFGASRSAAGEVRIVQESVTVTLVAEDGLDLSAESVAGRLRDFALSLFRGGDRREHQEKMVRAMEVGYRQAETAFGGSLPEVCRHSVDRAAELLEAWAGEGTAPPATAALDLVA